MYRILLTGMALGPALAAALPLSGIAVAVSGLGSAYALMASMRLEPIRIRKFTSGGRRAETLLQSDLSNAQKRKLPNQDFMLRELLRVMSVGREFQPPGAPPCRDNVIALTLRGLMLGWKTKDLTKLSELQRCELYLINTLLRSDPGEAGRIAQLFARPETMLDLRDEIDAIALRRTAFDRDYGAFVATRDLWTNGADTARPMIALLQGLGAADIDLWHHVVTRHDLSNPDQRRAAVWCLQQKDVNRSTVAAFFGRLAKEQALRTALAQGDTEFLTAVQGLIGAWNDSFYKLSELALSPALDVRTLKPLFEDELEYMQEHAGGGGWIAPHCLFVEYDGRAPRNRDLWDLHRSCLTQPPRQADCFEAAFESLS
ncbi:hypothetical protein C8N36_105217 [Pelagimonas varians]|uniref:Uncharacterized protein n=3 Tax=Pelagimonas varians TaxID=696760 RepID=A0A238KC28_9RHOB|nr:hypothetical protein C8N36_105217 [Pelagimonas varians]SMX39752.1 hypothetical protein PEV8663_01857 [Pelagimonas varians]